MPKRPRTDHNTSQLKRTRASCRNNISDEIAVGDASGPSGSGHHESPSIDLVQEVLNIAKNRDRAELMILELMRKYSFDIDRLRELLRENRLEVSFSKVKYKDIAPLFGLKPASKGKDIPIFEMRRARVPNATFQGIMQDLSEFSAQYLPVSQQSNEEARARFLSAYFNKTVALFSGLLYNRPEAIIEGRVTTKGRVEYLFETFGGVTVIFIEVKYDIGTPQERLDCFAQVIAECDAGAWSNLQNGFKLPLLAVLCDAKSFYFFKFVDKPENSVSKFFRGKFSNGDWLVNIENIEERPSNYKAWIANVRYICDSLYYLFLSGYVSGLEAYWNQIVKEGDVEAPGWEKVKTMAELSLKEATSACVIHEQGNIEDARILADKALQHLKESVGLAPYKSYIYGAQFTADMADI